MRKTALIAALALSMASPAAADVAGAVDSLILPGYRAFAETSKRLASAAEADCTAPALQGDYQRAFDAWLGVQHIRFGPVEDQGRGLAIAFWPDPRGLTESTLRGLIAAEDPVVETPDGFAQVSVAARGLFALDLLLYDPDLSDYEPDSYSCTLVTAIAADLSRMATAILADWQHDYAHALRVPSASGAFRSEREAAQALFTALMTGLEFDADQRLGRPLGTFDRPRPTRAEAWRSGRSLRNVTLSLEALRDLAEMLPETAPHQSLDAFALALREAGRLDDPVFAGVSEPQDRIRVESLQQRIDAVRDVARAEIGPSLGVAAGFNSADGD